MSDSVPLTQSWSPISSQAAENSSQEVVVGTPSQSQAPSPAPSHVSTVSFHSSAPSTSAAMLQSDFPVNFSIPNKWRPSIMFAIEEKILTPDVRNEIVRDLVTHMYGFMEKPSPSFCKFVAQRLILRYKFMRDSIGTGYVSSYMYADFCLLMWTLFRVPGKKSYLIGSLMRMVSG